MDKISIGRSGLETSRIGLGTWAIGGWMWGGTDEAESIATIRSAVERGATLIDTAPAYGFGRAEEIVGKALAEGALRDKVTIATKVGLAWKDGAVFRDSRPARIRKEVEDSLRRLRTDVIDLYQVHWPDLETPVAETAGALEAFAPRREDSGNRRQQLFADADGRFRQHRQTRRRAAALQSIRARERS
jgi:aryl-alcohol dehydrogenase-like predicted oxidoreductase